MRDSFQDMEESSSKAMVDGQQSDTDMKRIDELSLVACEMVRLIETATATIFGVDSGGLVNGWNSKVAELTGLQASESMGKSLARDIVHKDSCEVVEGILRRAMQGEEEKNVELKLRTFGHHQRNSAVFVVANACTSRNHANNVIEVGFVGQDVTSEKLVIDKFFRLQGDYKAIIKTLYPLIPPIFASDENASCCEWNAAMEKLTAIPRQEAIGKMLPGEIFGGLCRLKGQDTLTKFMILLYRGLSGQDTEKSSFGFFNRRGKFIEVLLAANRRTDADGNIIGCFCFLQIVEPDLQQTLDEHKQPDQEALLKIKELAYMRQEMKSPLSGIRFTRKLLEDTATTENQKQFLETSDACEKQIMAIIEDIDLARLEEGNIKLKIGEFLLVNVLDALVSQVMILPRERNLQLFHEIPEEIKTVILYGDQIRLQLVLSDFLLSIVRHAPSPNGWVEIKVSPGLKLIQDGNEFVRLQIRMTHPGQGLPSALIEDMFEGGICWTTEEGLALNLSHKLIRQMNGHVHYTRAHNQCFFCVDIELKSEKGKQKHKQVDTSTIS